MRKYQDEEWLEEQLVDRGREPFDIADECGVQKETIFKWRKKLNVGEQYQCEVCSDKFPTRRGRNMHHKKNHGLSTGGFEYICENCGVTFSSPRPPHDDKAPSFCGQDCYGSSIEGDKNPNKEEERRKKISETMKKVHEEGRGDYGDRDSEWMMENVIKKRDNDYLYENNDNIRNGNLISKPQYVEETGRNVRSSWEAEIDILLHESDIEYEYEPRRYELPNGKTYMPDFEVGNTVIEVKGYIGEGVPEKVQLFMDTYPEKEYVVVGEKIPCDVYIPWKNREEIVGFLQ